MLIAVSSLWRSHLRYEEEEEEDLYDTPSQSASASGSHFEWQQNDGQRWLRIDNDHVIEAHYCQPGAKGMTIYTPQGQVYIDFDTINTPNAAMGVRRLTFLPQGQTETMGWYFRDNRLWREYSSQGSNSGSSSVSSQVVEQKYSHNPQGTFRFTVGSAAYSLDFSALTQTNLATLMQRNVRRRPKFNSVNGSVSSALSTLTVGPHLPPSAGYIWEFMGEEGVWTKFKTHRCSFDSAAIEGHYQQNPQGTLRFKAGRYSYTLNFVGMYQTNDKIGTKRAVRRTPCGSEQGGSGGSGSQPRWQFQDVDGSWKDYGKKRGKSKSSVSSQDIEVQYQQDTNGTLAFSTMSFNYELDFSVMTQRNMSTNTTRSVQRLPPVTGDGTGGNHLQS